MRTIHTGSKRGGGVALQTWRRPRLIYRLILSKHPVNNLWQADLIISSLDRSTGATILHVV